MPYKRLDVYLKDSMNISRAKAQQLISAGCVLIDGRIAEKPSAPVGENSSVEVTEEERVLKYAGRGGYKLEGAVKRFGIEIRGVCIDIGASTGGFTDCMLKCGAERVYAVDVGTAQLAEALKRDKRVISLENTDIRYAKIERADFIGCDVSFISLTKIFSSASALLKENGRAVFLIKPQFESGRGGLNKKGIVRDKKIHIKVLENIISSAEENGLRPIGLMPSPIQGGDGNTEYLLYTELSDKEGCVRHNDIISAADEAFGSTEGR